LYEFLEDRRISFSERVNGSIQELKPQLSDAASFIPDSAPKLVIEKVYFPGYAHPHSSAGFSNR